MKWVGRVYDETHAALWATLIASLVFFTIFGVPNIRNNRGTIAAAIAQEIEQEHAFYCRRWKFQPSEPAYESCMADLEALRQSTIKRLVVDSDL